MVARSDAGGWARYEERQCGASEEEGVLAGRAGDDPSIGFKEAMVHGWIEPKAGPGWKKGGKKPSFPPTFFAPYYFPSVFSIAIRFCLYFLENVPLMFFLNIFSLIVLRCS